MLTLMIGTYLCSALLVGGFEEHIESWTYLNKNLVVAGLWSVLVFLAKALDGIIDLPLASLADKIKTKFGRRKTAIVIGFIPMIVSYLLFLVPLEPHESIANTVWFGVLLCAFYTCYTMTMLTYYATFSEVCETEQDTVFLSNVKSVCDVIYFIFGYALVPVFIGMEINIRVVALIFLPLSLTMVIPMFLLKENSEEQNSVRSLTLTESLATAFKIKPYIFWMCTAFVMNIGLQLFLGGINELFSTTGLNMTVVMASSFAPVPFTIVLYNYLVKKFGFGFGYRYIVTIYAIGMSIMYICNINSHLLTELQLTLVAVLGGIFISFAIGAFFSVNYTVPTHLARKEFDKSGKSISGMLFAVQGLFEGVSAGIATGFILVMLKNYNVISLLPIIVVVCCIGAFIMSTRFSDEIAYLGKVKREEK